MISLFFQTAKERPGNLFPTIKTRQQTRREDDTFNDHQRKLTRMEKNLKLTLEIFLSGKQRFNETFAPVFCALFFH